MTSKEILELLAQYEMQLSVILERFKKSDHSLDIGEGDGPLLQQIVEELCDLLYDNLGKNNYSELLAVQFHEGQNNFVGSPSFYSVESIRSTVRSASTRLRRNPDVLINGNAQDYRQIRENVFIIHGRDEAKRRELTDIVKDEFHLNPIVLSAQPNKGLTVIEKFEAYAPTCSFAIAVFTPDDQVMFEGESYLQVRPNVVYEVGWFSARLGRKNLMLLLKDGTSIFSDFGGILQLRFRENVSEKAIEIRNELVAAGLVGKA